MLPGTRSLAEGQSRSTARSRIVGAPKTELKMIIEELTGDIQLLQSALQLAIVYRDDAFYAEYRLAL